MTTTTTPTQQSRYSSRSWLKSLTAACVLVASPAVIALGVAASAHADSNSGHGATQSAATHSAASVAVPTPHQAFPGQAHDHTSAVSGASHGQHGAVVHHRHRGGKGADAGDSGE